ncbi:phosphatase PAP2 family protein [Xylanivirga thermophila]|jgi:membrane-associated phospholipid phosphatase|uniref:phosphatase PAP2 family protein n=2 Tax=Xylanivirga thermophila TaxID=2496273 RepID=UPI00101CDA88|nr:phosphatase PAP2 family protein [Xylanivirga thermophila]
MNRVKKFIRGHSHFYLLFIFVPLLMWFSYCEKNIVPEYILHTALDNKIPFIKVFIIPYVIWYFYVAFGLIYTGINSKEAFYRLLIFISGGMAVCYILYMLFPNGQDLRPDITETDMLSRAIKFLYTIDTPTNVCPSIHVFNSIGVDAALRNLYAFSNNKKKISFFLMISICLSTIFVKQHSIIDVIYGTLLAAIFYIPLYAIPNIKLYKSYNKKFYSLLDIFKIAVNYKPFPYD